MSREIDLGLGSPVGRVEDNGHSLGFREVLGGAIPSPARAFQQPEPVVAGTEHGAGGAEHDDVIGAAGDELDQLLGELGIAGGRRDAREQRVRPEPERVARHAAAVRADRPARDAGAFGGIAALGARQCRETTAAAIRRLTGCHTAERADFLGQPSLLIPDDETLEKFRSARLLVEFTTPQLCSTRQLLGVVDVAVKRRLRRAQGHGPVDVAGTAVLVRELLVAVEHLVEPVGFRAFQQVRQELTGDT